jgi:hypothetical protein
MSLDLIPGLSRRGALAVCLTAATTGLLPRGRAFAQTGVSEELQLRLLRWSRMATGFTDLPGSSARTYLEWALRSGFTADQLAGLDAEVYRGTPLEKRLLEAWYTGVFKAGGSSEVRSYDTTLMWPAAGIDPPPTTCGGTPDRWDSVPSKL